MIRDIFDRFLLSLLIVFGEILHALDDLAGWILGEDRKP